MSGHIRSTWLVVICVLAAALPVLRVHAQPATPPAGQSPAPSAPPADAPITTREAGCKTPSKASAGGASVIQSTEESLQHKNWQARGGEIQFTVQSFVAIPADASVLVCFRWKSPPESNTGFIERRPSRLELNSDRTRLTVTTTVPNDLGPRPSNVETALPLVPLAEVRILAINNGTKAVAADATTVMGITYPWAACLFTMVTVGLGFLILHVAASQRLQHPGIRQANWLLRIISTPSGFASLSQFQIILWTFVVAASAVYVMSLSGQLVQITNGMLVLLGIAGAAGIGAKAHNETQVATAETTAAKAAADRDAASIMAAQKEADNNAATGPTASVLDTTTMPISDKVPCQATAALTPEKRPPE